MTSGITYNDFRAGLVEDGQFALDERAAVMEYEGKMPRPEAERLQFWIM